VSSPERSQKDIFASTSTNQRRSDSASLFRHLHREKKPKPFVIRKRECKSCGDTVTNLMGYRCARKQFGGWWGRWKDVTPCD
jgi:hypothetical protein